MKGITKKLRGLVFCLVFLTALVLSGRVEVFADTLTMTIERFTLGGSFIMEPEIVTFNKGDKYDKIVKEVLKKKNLSYSGNNGTYGFYLAGIDGVDVTTGTSRIPDCVIDLFRKRGAAMPSTTAEGNLKHPGGLYEFSYTSGGGWMYYVNNQFVLGMSNVTAVDGDAMRLMFSFNGGMDLTGTNADVGTGSSGTIEYYHVANKTDLVKQMGIYNSRKGSWSSDETKAYNYAKNVMAKMNASETDVANALRFLKDPSKAPSTPSNPSDPSEPSGPSLTPDDPGTGGDVGQDVFQEGAPMMSALLSTDKRSVVVSWSSYAGAESYEVLRRSGGAFSVLDSVQNGLSYTDSSIEPGKNYYYSVRAVSTRWGDVAKSQDAKSVYVSVPAIADKPAAETKKPGKAAISQVTSASYNSLKITWGKVKNATGYIVTRSTAKNGTYKKVGTVSADKTNFTNTGLVTGKTYYYKVQATNDAGKGTASTAKSGKSTLGKPAVTVTAGKKKATVKWKKISGASGYVICRSTSKGKGYKTVKTITKGTIVSFTNTKLTSKETYYYKVRAYRTVSGKKVYSVYSNIVGKKIQ